MSEQKKYSDQEPHSSGQTGKTDFLKNKIFNLNSRAIIPMMAHPHPRPRRVPSASWSFHQYGVYAQVAQTVR